MMIPQGVRSPVRSATSDKVNITIWNGTTMENTQSKYNSFVNLLFTLVIYHAHIEVHTRITSTEPTVINTVQPTAPSSSYLSIADRKLSIPTHVCFVGSLNGSLLINTLFLNELISTIRIGMIYTTPMIANAPVPNQLNLLVFFFITAVPP